MKNKIAIQAALDILIAEGRKSFVEGVNVSDGDCIGLAISAVNNDPRFTMTIAAAHAEDWNFHNEAKAIRDLTNCG